MAASTAKPKLVAIVGPTASGKSGLAMQVALEFDGEIITADSRTIYKGLNIGTAKPSAKDQNLVRHWGLDLIEPGQKFSAKTFKDYAQDAIRDIQNRGKLPILVGGTGLYVDSVLFGFDFRPIDPIKRVELEELPIESLHKIIVSEGFKMPENTNNKRHLARVIESKGALSSSAALQDDVVWVGLLPADDILRERIAIRAKTTLDALLAETSGLLKKYSEETIASGGISYGLCRKYLNDELDKSELEQQIVTKEWQYARRQKTWFKRNRYIQWFDSADKAEQYLENLLNT